MLTPLDLHLPTEDPYGAAPAAGTVAAILITANAEAPLSRVDEAEAVAGRGLAGDRYAAGRGTFSGPGRGYQLTLAEAEMLDEVQLPWNRRAATSSRAASPSTASSADASGSAPSNASAAGWPNRAPTSRNSRDPDSFAHSFTEAVSAPTSPKVASFASATTSKRSTSSRKSEGFGIRMRHAIELESLSASRIAG